MEMNSMGKVIIFPDHYIPECEDTGIDITPYIGDDKDWDMKRIIEESLNIKI